MEPVTVEIPLLLFSLVLSLSPTLDFCVLPFHFISFISFISCYFFVSPLALGDIHRDNVSLTRNNLRLFQCLVGDQQITIGTFSIDCHRHTP